MEPGADRPGTAWQVSRRRVLAGTAGLVAAGSLPAGAGSPRAVAAAGAGAVRLTQGTNVAADVSPDGRWVAFDLAVSIWVVPVEGGDARRLTDDLQDATLPHWSPDGGRIAFQSYRDGNYHVWSVRPDGSDLLQHTSGRFDHREPRWSPDGSRIVLSSDRAGGTATRVGSYGVWVLDVASGDLTPLTDTTAEEAMPSWSPDGSSVVFTSGPAAAGTTVEQVAVATGERAVLVPAADGVTVFAPTIAPDGTLLHVRLRGAAADLVADGVALTSGEDVFALPASVLGDDVVYTADGQIRRRPLAGGGTTSSVPFTATLPIVSRRPRPRGRSLADRRERRVLGIASPVVSADGERIAFRALGALWLGPVGGTPEKLVDDGFFASDPDFHPDGTRLVYASDRGGSADLWARDLLSRNDSQLSMLPGAATAPRWSPTGDRVAYHDEDGAGWVLDVASGESTQVTPVLFQPGRFSWGPDGRHLALAAVKPFSARFREGTSQVLVVDLDALDSETGGLRYLEPGEFASLSTRGDDGPVWSPDGARMAFVVASTLHVVDVDPDGTFTSAPRRITDEVTDAPVWRGSDRLLYLSNGVLREVSASGGPPSTVSLELTWRRPVVRERLVLRVGAVWDGESESLRRDVDVVLAGDRVVGVRPRSRGPAQVDEPALTLMPGLVDAHNHWHLRGRAWGERQGRLWLSYGITSTRSPGDPAYQMAETREALTAGTRIGPRFFATGEAVDGSRVYYNFMRPTRDAGELALEVARAAGLEYELVKTYVRLPVERQREAVRQVHDLGLKLSSHYLYPAENFGMDGMEHTGATNRLGYSHTVSRLGRAYSDVVDVFAASGMSVTPTLFNSTTVHVDDPSLVEDVRTRDLFPPWEYEALLAEVSTAAGPAGEATRALLAANVDMVLRIHRAGGLVIAGTDAPLDNVAISLHANLRAMVQHGFTPYEALRTATHHTARWLGLERELGVVRPGAQADLVLVEGDPLTDIRSAAAVRHVLVGGRRWTVDELVGPFAASSPAGSSARPSAAADVTPTRRVPLPHRHDEPWWHESERFTRVCCGV